VRRVGTPVRGHRGAVIKGGAKGHNKMMAKAGMLGRNKHNLSLSSPPPPLPSVDLLTNCGEEKFECSFMEE